MLESDMNFICNMHTFESEIPFEHQKNKSHQQKTPLMKEIWRKHFLSFLFVFVTKTSNNWSTNKWPNSSSHRHIGIGTRKAKERVEHYQQCSYQSRKEFWG